MNLDRAKETINSYLGKKCSFVYKGARNQVEKFDGIISNCFPYIFIIKLDNGQVKSFSYNDFIIKNIKIIK